MAAARLGVSKYLVVPLSLALLALAMSAPLVAAKNGGNSDNAKLCQKGGWMDYTTSDGTPFANQDDCVSYAANGGTLTPLPAYPIITTQPQDTTIFSGQTATLTVTASGSSLSYQWYQGVSGDTSTPVGTDSDSFTTPALTTNTSYWVQVSNLGGSVKSNTATVTIEPAPSITTQPQSQIIASGQTATLTVVASGSSLSYQWYQGVSGDTSTPVGTDSDSFTTPALTTNTSYWVQVSNLAGHADSDTATITVEPAP